MRAPDFWFRPSLKGGLLAPLGFVYGQAVRVGRVLAPPAFHAAVPVVCVGNLVMGGAGKTPVAQSLASHLLGQGQRPAILLRGYGGSEKGPLKVDPLRDAASAVGDEALLHAALAPTWIGADRAQSAKAAIADGADILLMDDGLQNATLFQDLPLVVVDGETGFGNGLVFPAGPLRENIEDGLKRAKAVVVIGDDKTGIAKRLNGQALFTARIVLDDSASRFLGRKAVAFAGIGRPDKFFASLKSAGARIVEARSFPDHHPFTQGEIDGLKTAAQNADALLVTTAKDHVRLPPAMRPQVETLKVSLAWDDAQAPAKLLSLI